MITKFLHSRIRGGAPVETCDPRDVAFSCFSGCTHSGSSNRAEVVVYDSSIGVSVPPSGV